MNDKSQQRLSMKEIYFVASEIPRGEQREAYLQKAAGHDLELLQGLKEILADAENSSPNRFDKAIATIDLPSNSEDSPPIEIKKHPLVGPYKLIHRLGDGGMGEVFIAEQRKPVQRTVALKLIKRGMDSDEVIARFEAERQALAMMDHPNIAKVLDAGQTDDGRPFFVMDLVRGVQITEYCDQHKLSTQARLELLVEVCQAVQHAHQKGIIHRDLKPSNILVELHDVRHVPKVIDFGVAKAINQRLTERTLVTQFAQMVGTPLYMSPEQAELSGIDVDTRSDVYALGVLMYELLTGSTPFDKETLRSAGFDEMRRMIREDDPPRPSYRISTLNDAQLSTLAERQQVPIPQLKRNIERELDWIVLKALEKDRTRRYESASVLAADIGRYLDDEAVEACPPSVAYRFRKSARRHRGLVGALGAAAIFILMAAGLLWAERGRTLAALAGETQQRALSDSNAREALSERNIALLNQYNAEIVSGQADWQNGHFGRLERKLFGHLPISTADDRRGWEWYYLLSLCRQEQRTLYFPMTALDATWSPDGTYVAAAGSVWRADSGENVQRTVPSRIVTHGGAWSPDGTMFAWGAASDDNGIYIWNRSTDEVVELRGHTSSVWCLDWSPDGERLASGGIDKVVVIWDVAAKSIIKKFQAGEFVTDVAWSPNGELVAVGIKWNDLKIWNSSTNELLADRQNLSGRTDTYWVALSWHPKGQQLAVITTKSWLLIDRHDWKVASKRNLELARGKDIAWHPDGQKIAVADGHLVSVWDPTGQKPTQTLRGHLRTVEAIAWSPDGRRLVTSEKREEVKIWDLNSLGQPPVMSSGGPAESLSWLPDNRTLAVVDEAEGSTSFWSTRDGSRVKVEPARAEGQHRWSPQRRLVAQIVDSDGGPQIRVLEPTSGTVHSLWQGDTGDVIRRIAWSPDGSKLAIRMNDGPKSSVQVWDVHREMLISRWTHRGASRHVDASQNEIAWSHDGTRIAVAAMGEEGDNGTIKNQGLVYVVNVARGITELKHNPGGWRLGTITSLAWRPDGGAVGAGVSDGLVEVVDIVSGRALFSTQLHNTSVNSVAWSPDGHRIVSAAEDGSVKVVSSARGDDVLAFDLEDGASHAAWSSDGERLAVVTELGNIHVWDASRGYEFSNKGDRRGELAWAHYHAANGTTSDRPRLRAFLDVAPDTLEFWEIRGHAKANLGDFDGAVQEFAKAIGPGLGRSFKAALNYGYALLATEQYERYRKHCKLMLEQFSDTQVASNGGSVAWTCTLVDDGDHDSKTVLRLAQANANKNASDGGAVATLQLGAALYRDLAYQTAADLLAENTTHFKRSSDPGDQGNYRASLYFLAMARYKLDHKFQATRYLNEATEIAKRQSSQLSWIVNAQLTALEKEAVSLIGSDE